MKRLASIFFITILLFNLAGYRLLVQWLQEQHAVSLTQKIDSGIAETELISIKVPASLPYYANSADFQWVDGEVAIKGIVYQYVKRRIYNDSIEFLCLANTEKTRLQNAKDLFFQLANSLQNTKEKRGSLPQIKLLSLEYCNIDRGFEYNGNAQALLKKFKTLTPILLPYNSIATPEQPPDAQA